jgi:hypothetical protein
MEKTMQKTSIETNGAVRRITTHEASIKTATVEVKALTISGKQVTLSVFRQLPDEDLIDPETGQLTGEPWGRVNYFWGNCTAAAHLHVVWQKGDELRRACVFESFGKRYSFRGSKCLSDEDHYLLRRARQMEVLRALRDLRSGRISSHPILKYGFQCFGCLHSLSDFRKTEGDGYSLLEGYRTLGVSSLRSADLHSRAKEYLDRYDYSPEEYSEFEDLASQFNDHWDESYTAIASTEQLFIAV